MKTLNRPMFRYGGPIKEGIMDGIRENKRHGGSMSKQFNTGLVGDERYPKTDGREHHFAVAAPIIAAGSAAMRFLPAAYRGFKANKYVKGMLPTGTFRKMTSPTIPAGFRAGAFAKENPGTTLTLASLAGTGGSKLLGSKEPEKKGGGISEINKQKRSVGMPENLTLRKELIKDLDVKELTEAEIKALEAKARMEKMDSYKEIMDIKGMSRDAAYKSLIDASKIIGEGGNLKKSIKDGSLIQKLTGAASKRFDKVSDTEAALRSLVVKGEITNEMNKEAKALARRKDELAIKTYEKQLKGKSIQEIRNEKLVRDGELIGGNELASLIRGKTNGKVSPKVLPITGFKVGEDPIMFATNIITAQNEDETTPDYPEGTYIIKDRVIYVGADGSITPVNDLSGI